MTFSITASFPLGTYQGHSADGTAELLPDPARLHSALLCAAAQGPRAVVTGANARPCAEDDSALRWLEEHPPTGLAFPEHSAVSDQQLIAFRKEGVIRVEGGQWMDKTTRRGQSDGTALNGPIGWIWDTEVPESVQESLVALCVDVPCLGEATSPVLLRAEAVKPTMELDLDASAFDAGGTDVRVAGPGRTSALQTAHRATQGKGPSVAQDQHTTSELPAPSEVSTSHLALARYRVVDRPELGTPWSQVVLVPTDQEVRPDDQVAWCVAVHRALIARTGTGASPMLTGAYEPGAARPANRLAIQFLGSSLLRAHGYTESAEHGAFALFVPTGASAEDRAQLAASLRGWNRVTRSARQISVDVAQSRAIDGGAFWRPKQDGLFRFWATYPSAVPETRPQTDGSGRRWGLADAALVSVGMVWRDQLAGNGLHGPALYQAVHSAAAHSKVEIKEIAPIHSSRSRRHVHVTQPGLVVQPYRARLTLGDLADETTAVVIGQSRHLGGGLLVPCDVPVDIFDRCPEGAA